MAVNDPNYRYATQTWEADGVRTEYEIAFDGGYIRQSDVVAFSVVVDPDTELVDLDSREVHIVNFLSESVDPETEWKTATVEITPAVASGRRVVIFRSTQKSEPLVNYQDNSVITEKNLDLANQQAIFAIAEIMDGLNSARIDINMQVQEVIDINIVVSEIYTQVLELLASGGIVSVTPQVWSGYGDGETTDFPIPGADVSGAGFYDTYVGGVGLPPDDLFSIVMGATPADTVLRFTFPPGDSVQWFTVLRGFAKPYLGDAPVLSLRTPVITVEGTSYFIDGASEFALIRCTSADPVTLSVKPIPVSGEGLMGTGSYCSAVQRGDGQVEIVPETEDVTLVVPAGFLAKTRAAGSTISITCEFADGNSWIVSGDLAEDI